MLKNETRMLYYLSIIMVYMVSCSSGISLQNERQVQVESEVVKRTIPTLSPPPRQEWQVATFRGLKMGKARIDDLRKVFGEPLEIVDLNSVGNKNDILYRYDSKEKIIGKMVAWVNKKTQTIVSIELRPDSMSKREVLDYFGKDYIITKYNFKDCPGETFDSAPMYESPNGTVENVEYRDKGVAIAIFDDNDMVQHILYLSEPFGSESSKCSTN